MNKKYGEVSRNFEVLAAFLLMACQTASPADGHYVGPEPCALCHKDIAVKQARTAMATTWQGRLTPSLPSTFDAAVSDDLPYELKRTGDTFSYSVAKMSLPVDILMGGRRHGLGFLIPLSQVDGIPLARPALIQARYAWSPEKKKLLLAPGCSSAKPQSLEAALGLVMSPTFEKRCLSCHGQPNLLGAGKTGGVHCESCHGPGSQHLVNPRQGIINPKRLSTEDSIGVCAQCHIGLARFADPSADDLLVANQVRAIKGSECFVQSGKAFSCTTCHDPHNDATDDKQAVQACLACHASGVKKHAAICPVNAAEGCIACHMPSVEMGPLHLVDHLIRVHPEQKIQAASHGAELKTQVPPISGYLRIIVTKTAEAAATARERIRAGESFYTVAQETSVDQTASIGGYLGRRTFDAGERLDYGETSEVKQQKDGRWVILQRLPRDFRWSAEQLQREAENLAASGDAAAAIKKSQEALKIYPHFLRALSFIGITFAQSGNARKGAEVLALAVRIYADDAPTKFALASVLEALGETARATEGFRQTIALEPDFTAAYGKLGMISYSAGDWENAIKTFRQGLQIDPMSTELNYDLGQALMRSGDVAGGKQAAELARKLDLTAKPNSPPYE